jgi:hypothetical protein
MKEKFSEKVDRLVLKTTQKILRRRKHPSKPRFQRVEDNAFHPNAFL